MFDVYDRMEILLKSDVLYQCVQRRNRAVELQPHGPNPLWPRALAALPTPQSSFWSGLFKMFQV